ncbi:hypothetical protein [Amycolatopsis oliviviridis]|uniref:Uncharacterized protein n=1 Tax=Amycolatopsis oliviviridis TaxID=1471590 RepID=A0ABQ3MH82_9PSEU|nr:hypothetical protein [Amycolatopsis oliviviridis]GHH37699.1 hypothetical protein GCM10017790_82360 [Amycolatopsis oliviviridis]
MKLPHDIVELVTTYIRVEMHEIGPPPGYDPRRIYNMYAQATANSAEFLAAVAAAVLPAGGEAARGGARLVWELLSVDHFDTDRNARAMLIAGVRWARATRRPLVPYEMTAAFTEDRMGQGIEG